MKNFTSILALIFGMTMLLHAQNNSGQQPNNQQNGQSMLQLNPNISDNNNSANRRPGRPGRPGYGYGHGHGNGHGQWGHGHGQGQWGHGHGHGQWGGQGQCNGHNHFQGCGHGFNGNSCQGPFANNNQGYGHYNCHNYGWRPVCASSFTSGCQSIRHYVFDNDRLMAAKRFASHNYLSVQQVCQIMRMFTFESTKLKFAKFAFGRTCDIQNYYLVYNCLTFNSSRRDLDSHIQRHYYR